jgi:hypothetical protein
VFQFSVEVRDGGNLFDTDRATVQVNVIRNNYPPLFFPLIYNQTISESASVGSEVIRVSASDQDTNVSSFLYFCCVCSLFLGG